MFESLRPLRLALASAAILLASQMAGAQQLSYSKGQLVYPAYEGWEKNADGSFNLLFGYMNSNWEEEFDVPIGPENNFEPGGPDRGQPTHFFPRRNRFVFRVRVPADFGQSEVVWTLVTHGKTQKAYGSLRQDYFVDNMVFTSENGAIGAGVSNPEIRANKPPVLEAAGDRNRTAKVGEPLTLWANATDDGIPKPRPRGAFLDRTNAKVDDMRLVPPKQVTVGSATGLWVACYKYRGPGNVTFTPPQPKTWEDTRAGANSQWAPLWQAPPVPPDGKWTVQVSFDEPGVYVLRWHATDGALWADEDITVTVTR
ncbi:MAG TPA: hypothetical protein VK419_03080 [Bryobacteraceae bacterium]|nr:hypothetical protein [Bryobacteraceae bacterium]